MTVCDISTKYQEPRPADLVIASPIAPSHSSSLSVRGKEEHTGKKFALLQPPLLILVRR